MRNLTLFLLPLLLVLFSTESESAQYSPCCSFPCQNEGVCLTTGFTSYTCDCTGTGFYGQNCQYPTLLKQIKVWLKPDSETVHHLLTNYKWFWNIVNAVPFLRNAVMKKIYLLRSSVVDSPPTYTSDHEYITMDAANNLTYFTRALPPVPKDCPTQLGTAGKKELPDVTYLVDKLFKRTIFKPDPMRSSVLFSFFAQHFTHQFFKTDLKKGPGFTWGGHGVDVSHIYGKNKHIENMLRSFKDGRMKTQMLQGEEYPPYLKDVPVPMTYMPNVPEHQRFALGHEFFGLLPGLFLYATVWLREHNRVCGILQLQHPEWDDERLFQTTKLVILGETIRIVIEDYVQHLSNYNYKILFKPELLFGEDFQYQNRIAVEFNHLYHWHPLMPDEFNISGKTYGMKDYVFHSELVIEHGTRSFTDSLSKQRAGQMTMRNHGAITQKVAAESIEHGRQLRFQSFNNYRKRFNMKPYSSFQELTGDTEVAKLLEDMYGEIDGVEFYVGIMVEKRRSKAMFGGTIVEMGGPFSVKGLMANALCSPKYWKPSTFGGDVGFEIVQTATLQTLFCNNIEGDCPLVSFRVPDETGDVEETCESNCSRNEL